MNELVERHLTPTEIRQRQVDHLRLLTEIDNYDSEVEEHKRCVKEANTEIARLQVRERDIRKELRSGTVWEVRQQKMGFADADREPDFAGAAGPAKFSKRPGCSDMETEDECSARTVREEMASERAAGRGPLDTLLGIDGNSDEPDPETDPPEHDKPGFLDGDDGFGKFFPRAKDHEELRTDLLVVLQNQGGAPSKQALIESVGDVGTTRFDEVAHWTRMQLAAMNITEYPEFQCYMPKTPPPMPRALQTALGEKAPKKKRAPRKPKADPSFHGEHVD
jgi:hypothetical protein